MIINKIKGSPKFFKSMPEITSDGSRRLFDLKMYQKPLYHPKHPVSISKPDFDVTRLYNRNRSKSVESRTVVLRVGNSLCYCPNLSRRQSSSFGTRLRDRFAKDCRLTYFSTWWNPFECYVTMVASRLQCFLFSMMENTCGKMFLFDFI